jgi:hypothetical protein
MGDFLLFVAAWAGPVLILAYVLAAITGDMEPARGP